MVRKGMLCITCIIFGIHFSVDSKILEQMIYNKPFEETGALNN